MVKVNDDGSITFYLPGYKEDAPPLSSLRDIFAASALQGILTHEDLSQKTAKQISSAAYQMADAMIVERAKAESGDA